MCRPLLGISLCLAVVALPGACAQATCETRPTIDPETVMHPELRLAVTESPDTMIGVLLRTTRPPTQEDREALEECGLTVHSVIGEIVTGRIRADAAPGLAALPFVEYMEIARTIRTPRPPLPPPDDSGPFPDTDLS